MASSSSRAKSSGVVRSVRRAQTSSLHDSASPLARAPPTRAKSGCWTCRLRRKKCDENKRDDGSCDTCQRLRLQCLGWGAKRPDWCRDKDKVEQYKLDIKQSGPLPGNLRATVGGQDINGPLTPNASTNGLSSYAGHTADGFDFQPVFIPNSTEDHRNAGTNTSDYFGFSSSGSAHFSSDNRFDGDLFGATNPGELDLSSLLAYVPSQHIAPQHQHQIWSNQTTPELHESPNLNVVNPITSAIDQSMLSITLPPPPPANSANSSSPSTMTIPMVPSSTTSGSWDSVNFPPFGSLPSLYGSSSTAATGAPFEVPGSAPADATSFLTLPAHQAATTGTAGITTLSIPGFDGSQLVQAPPVHPHARAVQKHDKPPASVDADTVRKQVSYYFNRVRKMQFLFAGESTKDVLRDIVVANPYGVVTNAICALAAIHNTLVRKAAGKDAEDPESATSLPRRFYEKANEQLMASRIQTGAYTALDAAATLQLVSFSHFVGGIRGWEKTLKIAGDWYESTGITRHEAPLRAMWELNLTSKFASRLVVWYDVFSSVTLQRPARFLSTYRKMLRQDESVGTNGAPKFWRKDLNMQATMGCSDAVLLAIAETAELAHWRDQEKKQSSLSYRELNLRAEVIEQELRAAKEALELEEARAVLANSAMAPAANNAYFGSMYGNTTTGMGLLNTVSSSAPGTPSSTSGESVQSVLHPTPNGSSSVSLPYDATAALVNEVPSTLTAVAPGEFVLSVPPSATISRGVTPRKESSSSSSSTTNQYSDGVNDPVFPAGLSDHEVRIRTCRIFLEGASLYLHTIISDSNPNVPEVVDAVRAVKDAASLLQPSDVDRALVFPFFIAGCMAEQVEHREFFRSRLNKVHNGIGNSIEAVKIMERVWERRKELKMCASKQRVHWRDVMEESGVKLLLA